MAGVGHALRIASATHTGLVRAHNEDAIGWNAEIGFVVLADGMGGYNAGEVASGMAVAVLREEMNRQFDEWNGHIPRHAQQKDIEHLLRDKVVQANDYIYRAAQSRPQYAGMGTTLVAALFYDNQLSVAHIGDSRLYRLRAGELRQLTRDHSLLQEQIDSGLITQEDARLSRNKNLVTRALGVDPAVEPEIHTHDTKPEDIYLLCSDGLNDMVEDEHMGETLRHFGADPQLAANRLIQAANDNGGKDNVSAVLVKILHPFPADDGWLRRFLSWLK